MRITIVVFSLEIILEAAAVATKDWQQHQKEAGLTDLDRDPNAGHIERAELLGRASGVAGFVAALVGSLHLLYRYVYTCICMYTIGT